MTSSGEKDRSSSWVSCSTRTSDNAPLAGSSGRVWSDFLKCATVAENEAGAGETEEAGCDDEGSFSEILMAELKLSDSRRRILLPRLRVGPSSC